MLNSLSCSFTFISLLTVEPKYVPAFNTFLQNIKIGYTETRGSPGYRSFLSYNGSISNVVSEKIFEIRKTYSAFVTMHNF